MTDERALTILTDHLQELEDSHASEELIDAIVRAADVIGERIDNKNHPAIFKGNGDYSNLSPAAKEFIGYCERTGRKNPYHSIMSLIKSKADHSCYSIESVKKRYRTLHPLNPRFDKEFEEIVAACVSSAKKKGWI